jgi:DNA-binding transcriptional ArsR family regulator
MLEETFLVAAVGHPVRLQALVLFERTPSSARELGELVGLSPSAALYHVRKLAAAGLVEPHEIRRRRAFEERVWRTTTPGWARLEGLLKAAAPPGQRVRSG